jgi:hypothetical protein
LRRWARPTGLCDSSQITGKLGEKGGDIRKLYGGRSFVWNFPDIHSLKRILVETTRDLAILKVEAWW